MGGIEVDRSGTSPVGGRNVVTTIGGPNASDNNEITGNGASGGFGILVFEVDGAANGGFKNVATIENNNSSISGFDIGIDVTGGSATISANHIYDNTTAGIRFTGGGVGTVDDNDFEGDPDPDNGTDILYTATAGRRRRAVDRQHVRRHDLYRQPVAARHHRAANSVRHE